jgi:hypothetical protein
MSMGFNMGKIGDLRISSNFTMKDRMNPDEIWQWL